MAAKILSNYHTHNTYCDGKNTIEEVVQSAAEQGITHLGISSHAPVIGQDWWTMNLDEIDNYFDEIKNLKAKYADKLSLFTGLEVDYFCDVGLNPWSRPYLEQLDYYIGSVHTLGSLKKGTLCFVDYVFEEFEKCIESNYSGNIRVAVEEYYDSIVKLVANYKPTIIGHLDIIKKNNVGNCFFDEKVKWYQDIIKDVISAIKSSGCIVEVNTGGIRRYGEGLLYPSPDIIYELYRNEIPITVNGDSHDVEVLDFYYGEVQKMLKDIGYKKIKMLTDDGWIDYNI